MTRRAILLPTSLLLLALAGLALHFCLFLGREVAPPAATLVSIAPGSSLARISRQLEAAGVVESALYIRLLGRLRGDAQQLQAGEYQFSAPATPGQVLDRMAAGDVRRLRITIPEGFTIEQIASRLEQQGLARAEAFLRLTHDPGFISGVGLSADSLEGYLFPETYTFDSGSSLESILREMLHQLDRALTGELLEAAERQGLDRHRLLTLASIVQKEAGSAEEMPLIAAVFLNRLRLGMPLQSDPTVIYGIDNFDGNLTRLHLETATPYNTYRFRGLPPGPIASPGLEALQACAHPARVGYLYFVARGDGSHQFSSTLAEHNQAVRRYQLKR